jgi:hypothetical protein
MLLTMAFKHRRFAAQQQDMKTARRDGLWTMENTGSLKRSLSDIKKLFKN